MEVLFHNFERAQTDGLGPLLASTLEPVAPFDDPHRLHRLYQSSTPLDIAADLRSGLLAHTNTSVRLSRPEGQAWIDVYAAYWKAVGAIVRSAGASAVYDAWKELAVVLIKGYSASHFTAWTIPCLYVVGKYLRIFAIAADKDAPPPSSGIQEDIAGTLGTNERLEEAARLIHRIFSLCISDRAPVEESRKWGLYYTTNLLFKSNFKLHKISLCKSILKALDAGRSDIPDLALFPKSHVVTFRYYVGVIHFLDEDYFKAEEHLTAALKLCYRDARRNQERILAYFIPCHLINTHTVPTSALLAPYPRLASLFQPLARAIRRGDLAAFDAALVAGESELVRRRIYLTCERARDIALRNLLRKVYIAGGFESRDGEGPLRRTRVPVAEFVAAVQLGSARANIDCDEVECMLANMIYKSLMKGYIARDRGIVVLSKGAAFPGTGV